MMTTATSTIEEFANREYQHGFFTDVETDTVSPGLNEDVIRLISAKKQEPAWLLEWRLKAYRHWLTLEEPRWWPNVTFAPIDYQGTVYYSAPKSKKQLTSLDKALGDTARGIIGCRGRLPHLDPAAVLIEEADVRERPSGIHA